MYINDFYRKYFVPICLSCAKKKTLAAYNQVIDL